MKKILVLLCVATLTMGIYAQRKDLCPPLRIEGVLKSNYESYTMGTPVLITNVAKLNTRKTGNNGIYLATTIENMQIPIPSDKAAKLIEFHPKNKEEFWMCEYLKANMFEHYDNKGYQFALRTELIEESDDYLDGLSDLFYKDDYIDDFVRSAFAAIAPQKLNNKRPEYADIRIVQSPDPYTNMLADGTLLISTGLLSTLDSVEELTAIISSGIAHYVLDHPLINVSKEISRARRAEFWGGFLVAVAGGVEMALTETNEHYIPGGILLTAGVADAALNYSATKRLGMGYTDKQRKQADRIAVDFLKFAQIDPAALTSALTKIRNYYQREYTYVDDERQNFGNLNKRLSNLSEGKEFNNRAYQRTMSGINTTNAIIQLNSRNYEAARRIAQKNISNKLASDEDYVVLIKSNMQLFNTPESNEKCLELIQKAKQISEIPNLELYKQEILLLMRLNKQHQANDVVKEYVSLLSDFKENSSNSDDIDWAAEELQWANKLHQQLGLF